MCGHNPSRETHKDTAELTQMCNEPHTLPRTPTRTRHARGPRHARSHTCAEAQASPSPVLRPYTCVHRAHMRVLTHIHRPDPHHSPSPAFPLAGQSPGAPSLQEVSKDAVYTISSKEIIIIITLSDLTVKLPSEAAVLMRGAGGRARGGTLLLLCCACFHLLALGNENSFS